MIVQNNGTVNVIGPDAFIQVARGDDDIQSPNLARTGDVGDLQILSGGLVNIDDGGAAVNFPFAGFNIAQQVNATGSVLIQGAGSKMTLTGVSSSNGNVGRRGAGTLTIEQGGTLESLFLNVGREASGDGTVIVQDVGSSLLLSGDDGTFGPFASIGRLGTGDLQVINGGVMTLDNLGFGVFLGINVGGGGSDPGGTGTVAVSGAGSLISVVGDTGVFNVGRNGRGSLTVDTGGQITGATFFNVGFTAESIGTVTLDGPPSGAGASLELVGTASLAAEQNGVSTDEGDSAFLSIGVEGTAFMDVINGATVTIDPGVDASGMEDAPGLIIGGFGGSSGDGVGTLNVDGAGSQISVSTAFSSLNVGRNGTGFANIINGGVLTLDNTNGDASTFLGAEPGSFGTLIIDGAGSQLDAGEIFGIGFDHDFVDPFNLNPGGNGSLIVSNGASLTALDFFIDGSQSLPGFDPGGTAQIESGATVNVESVELGTNVGRAGKLSVSGGATTFSVSGPQSLIVGNGGDGFFDLFGGVTVDLVGVTNPGMEVGLTGTGSGLVNIVGAGSTLNIQGDGAFINVGNAGVGLMNVVAQATVTIDGAGPSQSLLQVGAASASGTLRLDNADVTITSVTDDSEILVGRDGASSGLVQLSSGARLAVLDNGRTIVAREAASTGDVFVQDATTSFEPGRLLVGLGSDEVTPGGTATIILDLGGTLTTNDFLSTGAVDIRDGDFDTALATLFDGTLDLGGGTFDSTGDMSVNDPALVDIASGVLSVGGLFSLDSMLSVQAGGTLNTFTAIMATAGAEVAQVDLIGGDWNDTGITVNVGDLGTAIVNVQGGSTLTTNRIIIGIEGNSVGTVNVFAGGSVNSNDVQMGEFALSSGAILIDGGVWTDTFNFTVSDAGVADITVINGGTVNSAAAIIGDGSASLATVLVDGSTWNNTGELVIGDDGDGSITVQNGGLVTVTTGPSVVAQRPGSIGVLIVADPTSQFDAGANLFIGVDPLLSPGGTGTLSLISDPTVTATTVTNAS